MQRCERRAGEGQCNRACLNAMLLPYGRRAKGPPLASSSPGRCTQRCTTTHRWRVGCCCCLARFLAGPTAACPSNAGCAATRTPPVHLCVVTTHPCITALPPPLPPGGGQGPAAAGGPLLHGAGAVAGRSLPGRPAAGSAADGGAPPPTHRAPARRLCVPGGYYHRRGFPRSRGAWEAGRLQCPAPPFLAPPPVHRAQLPARALRCAHLTSVTACAISHPRTSRVLRPWFTPRRAQSVRQPAPPACAS